MNVDVVTEYTPTHVWMWMYFKTPYHDIRWFVYVIDDTTSSKYIGSVGEIVHTDYLCGCGQSYPHDPMIGVRFDCGDVEEF